MSALIGELESLVQPPPSLAWTLVSETRYIYDGIRVINPMRWQQFS